MMQSQFSRSYHYHHCRSQFQISVNHSIVQKCLQNISETLSPSGLALFVIKALIQFRKWETFYENMLNNKSLCETSLFLNFTFQ